jgi:hypothetical protein
MDLLSFPVVLEQPDPDNFVFFPGSMAFFIHLCQLILWPVLSFLHVLLWLFSQLI